MLVRLATDADLGAIQDFLSANAIHCAYMLVDVSHSSNFGEYFIAEVTETGRVLGVMCITRPGRLLFFSLDDDALANLSKFILSHKNRIREILGPWRQAQIVTASLGIEDCAFALKAQDGLFALKLVDIQSFPLQAGENCVHASQIHFAVLAQWNKEYAIEAMGASDSIETKKVSNEKTMIQQKLDSDIYALLNSDKQPVALCGFNGPVYGGVLLVGPVWTSPAFRGRSYAKRLLYWSLNLVRQRFAGDLIATLLAYNPASFRVYEALGFRRIDDFFLGVLAEGRLLC